jgi:hypothetical protein
MTALSSDIALTNVFHNTGLSRYHASSSGWTATIASTDMRNTWITIVLLAVASVCVSCATTPPPAAVPERLAFIGTLDLSGQGVGFLLPHSSDLSYSGRYPSGRLPEQFTVEVICNDELTGVLTVTKTTGLHGTVALSDTRQGDVTFPAPPAVRPSPPVRKVASGHSYVRHGGGCGSRGGPGYRLPNGKCASWKHRRH